MLKYKEEENDLERYISENNDKLQNMHQDSHNIAAVLLNHKLPELIDSKKGDLHMGKNAIQAIYDRGENHGITKGDTLHRIFLITKKFQKGKDHHFINRSYGLFFF